jgi:histidine triad (HIT) family protein
MAECIFCAIAAHHAPAEVVYEDRDTIAFLDISPVADGHCLVVPKVHARNVFDISPESASAAMRSAVVVARAVKSAMQADGINLWQSNEPIAGQTVFHFHIHVVPRWSGDGGIHFAGRGRANPADLKRFAEGIRAALQVNEPSVPSPQR